MRKLILGLAVSLDSFIEGPNGEYDWCFTDQDYGMTEFLQHVDTMFMGRKSYELTQTMKGGTGLPKMKEYIFSTTLRETKNDAILVRGNIEEEVKRIKSEKGKDIWLFGGASLTNSLMKLYLVDELWLAVHPILLGAGKPLFSGNDKRIHLTLLESKTYDSGLVSLKYKLKGAKPK
ncbi:MAG: dihydrofolate reductase [Flammeovirgaceae bacterium]|nr:dihydrofolate reductase [Flammeovirgaceae bacterium]